MAVVDMGHGPDVGAFAETDKRRTEPGRRAAVRTAMTDRGGKRPENLPEGRGCLFLSLALVIIALLVFAIAAWIDSPGSAPAADATAGAPATGPAQ